jgi:septal ring factor EnvC (AmiA/AmiB activator)
MHPVSNSNSIVANRSVTVQASALAALVTAATAFAYLGISQIGYVRLVGNKESAVARMERANVDLQDNVANLRDRLAASARDRAMAEDRLSALANEANTLRGLPRIDRDETLRDRAEGLGARDAPPEQATEAGPANRFEAHMQIGVLGSTGRALGPDVHYEVIENGQAEDPERFISLARLVPISVK